MYYTIIFGTDLFRITIFGIRGTFTGWVDPQLILFDSSGAKVAWVAKHESTSGAASVTVGSSIFIRSNGNGTSYISGILFNWSSIVPTDIEFRMWFDVSLSAGQTSWWANLWTTVATNSDISAGGTDNFWMAAAFNTNTLKGTQSASIYTRGTDYPATTGWSWAGIGMSRNKTGTTLWHHRYKSLDRILIGVIMLSERYIF